MILIRADGNARIGLGHLMRCLTIAEELAQQGGRENICFVCADEASGAFVRENGFRSHVLGTDYRDMESELPLWKAVWEANVTGVSDSGNQDLNVSGAGGSGAGACRRKRAMVLVDSYYVTELYLTALSRTAYTILMDDYGTCCYPVDCVINYNAPADPEAYRKLYGETGTRLLIGSRYTPLRRQFRTQDAEVTPYCAGPYSRSKASGRMNAGTAQKEIFEGTQNEDAADEAVKTGQTGYTEQSEVREVLITTGGGDSGNIAGKILKRIYSYDFTFRLVTGRFHPNFRELQELEKKHDNIKIHHDVKDMAGLMARCQIALTAGGATIYELAALGVPFICFSYAENQEALVEYIGEKEIAGSAGAWHKEPEQTLERIGILFEKLAGNPEKREYYRVREMEMVDGEGAGRLARELLKIDEKDLEGTCEGRADIASDNSAKQERDMR